MTTFLAGFSLSISLILAIGSQNAFVLKQGIKKQHVLLICAICALSDAILITIGIAGFGVLFLSEGIGAVLKTQSTGEVISKLSCQSQRCLL